MKKKFKGLIYVTILMFIVSLVINNYSANNLDSYIEGKDNDINSIEEHSTTDNFKSSLNSSYSLKKLGTYSTDLSKFKSSAYGHFSMYSVNSKYVYCMEYGVDVADIATASNSSKSIYNTFSATQKKEITLLSSYASMKYDSTKNIEYLYAGQILIWNVIDSSWKISNTNTSIQKEINEVLKLKNNHNVVASFASTNSNNVKTYELVYNKDSKLFETILTNTNDIDNSKINTFVGTYGDFKVSKYNNSLKITTSNQNAISKVIDSNYISYGNGTNYFYDTGQDLISGSNQTLNMYFKVKVVKYFGQLDINKTGDSTVNFDDSSIKLSGITFDLVQDDIIKYSLTTDKNGHLSFKNVVNGTYTLIERNTPVGYIELEPTEITINAGETSTLDINNEIINSKIKIIKTNNDNEKLQGASFKIKKAYFTGSVDDDLNNIENYEISETDEVLNYDGDTTLQTNVDGEIIIDSLKHGSYVLIETESPTGYLKDSQMYLFHVDNNDLVTINVTNEQITNKITIKKIDFSSKKLISGAKLFIKDSEGNIVTSWTSKDSSHEVTINYGSNYQICEESAPSGYVKNNKCITFDVTEDGITQSFSFENRKITNDIYILKTDFSTGKELSGAKLIIYDQHKNVIDSWVSTKDEHKINISYGNNYIVCEQHAPKGYQKISECVKFDVTKDGVEQHLKIENKLKSEIIQTGINNFTNLLISLTITIFIILLIKKKMRT